MIFQIKNTSPTSEKLRESQMKNSLIARTPKHGMTCLIRTHKATTLDKAGDLIFSPEGECRIAIV